MIKGIFPPIPTPFYNDKIAVEQLKRNIDMWEHFDLSGYVVMGSNGEAVYLSQEEKLQMVETVRDGADADKIVIAGTGSDSINETVMLTNKCADAGADYALILTPSYYQAKMGDKAQLDYFNEVADASKIPILIYNVPKFTGININPKVVLKLSHHSNIVGIKNSSENIADLSKIIDLVPDDFSVLVGTASVLFPGLIMGASGCIAATANVASVECIDIYNAVQNYEYSKAKNLQLFLLEMNTAVTSQFGVAGLKYVMDYLGFYGGSPRLPMQDLSDKEKSKLDEIIERFMEFRDEL